MVVQPRLQAIGVNGAAAPGTIAEDAGSITQRGTQMRAAGKFHIPNYVSGEPLGSRHTDSVMELFR